MSVAESVAKSVAESVAESAIQPIPQIYIKPTKLHEAKLRSWL